MSKTAFGAFCAYFAFASSVLAQAPEARADQSTFTTPNTGLPTYPHIEGAFVGPNKMPRKVTSKNLLDGAPTCTSLADYITGQEQWSNEDTREKRSDFQKTIEAMKAVEYDPSKPLNESDIPPRPGQGNVYRMRSPNWEARSAAMSLAPPPATAEEISKLRETNILAAAWFSAGRRLNISDDYDKALSCFHKSLEILQRGKHDESLETIIKNEMTRTSKIMEFENSSNTSEHK